jgi:hypothetical protein
MFLSVFALLQKPRADAGSAGSSLAMQSQNEPTVSISTHFFESVSIANLLLNKTSSFPVLIISHHDHLGAQKAALGPLPFGGLRTALAKTIIALAIITIDILAQKGHYVFQKFRMFL